MTKTVRLLPSEDRDITSTASHREIILTRGMGSGPTELAAFDRALYEAGIGNYNLIPLSSVIPPRSILIDRDHPNASGDSFGNRLYLVLAQERASTPGREAWAGIGWVQDLNDRSGLLVEHHGTSESSVRASIVSSLSAMTTYRDSQYGEVRMALAGIRCEDDPVCALVAAVFKEEVW